MDSHQQNRYIVPMCGGADVQERRQHSGVKEHLGKLRSTQEHFPAGQARMGIRSGSLEHSNHPKWPQLGLPDRGSVENKDSKKEGPQESN